MQFFQTIDWGQLREQKAHLVEIVMTHDNPVTSPLTVDQITSIEGILNLLDALQDAAVASGTSEEVVFGKSVGEHVCPGCGEAIPDDAGFGEACGNCGQVFMLEMTVGDSDAEEDPNEDEEDD